MNDSRSYPKGALIDANEIVLADGRRWTLKMYQGDDRPSARLLRVYDGATVLFEVGGYDFANAWNGLQWKLAEVVPLTPEFCAKFEEPGYKPQLKADGSADSVEAAYWLRWDAGRQAAAEVPPLACDHCGGPADEGGQFTAENVICGPCVAKARGNAGRRSAADVLTGRGPIGFDLGGEGG